MEKELLGGAGKGCVRIAQDREWKRVLPVVFLEEGLLTFDGAPGKREPNVRPGRKGRFDAVQQQLE